MKMETMYVYNLDKEDYVYVSARICIECIKRLYKNLVSVLSTGRETGWLKDRDGKRNYSYFQIFIF